MKNLFLCLSFTLVSFCSFANANKESVVDPLSIEPKVFASHTMENVGDLVITYVFDAVSCHADITYMGNFVHSVTSYGYGANSFEATANCYKNARALAEAWIDMREAAISQQ